MYTKIWFTLLVVTLWLLWSRAVVSMMHNRLFKHTSTVRLVWLQFQIQRFLIKTFCILLMQVTIELERYLQFALRFAKMAQYVLHMTPANVSPAGRALIVLLLFAVLLVLLIKYA